MAGRTGARKGQAATKKASAGNGMGTPMPMRLSALERLYRQSGLFGWQLKSRQRESLRPGLQDPWQGNAKRGADIMAYRRAPANSETELAGFSWLRDLRACDLETKRFVREVHTSGVHRFLDGGGFSTVG